jgi:hypothetical protein
MRSINQAFPLVVILLLSALLEQQSEAATYYVATTGNDITGNGSLSNPWLTIDKGIRSLRASDTLYIRGGTYSRSGPYGNIASDTYGCIPACPSSWATATSIRNYPGEAVTISGAGFNMDGTISSGGVGYLIWEGDSRSNFIIQEATSQPQGSGCNCEAFRFVNGAHHVRVKKMTIRNYTGQGITGSGSVPSISIEIVDNEIRNNGNFAPLNGPYEHGIYPSLSDSWVIDGNFLVGNFAFGIHMYSGTPGHNVNGIIRNNTVEGRSGTSGSSACIIVSAGSGHQVYNNVCIAQGSQAGRHTIGIAVAYGRVSGAQVYNNTIYDTNYGIQTIDAANTIIRNNILNVRNDSLNINTSNGTTGSNNLCNTNDTDVSGACTVVTSTPGFVTPGSNFRLAAGSPAIDAGETISTVTYDRDGAARPTGLAYDIGAYEGNGATRSTLSPPKNLSVR